MQRCIYSNTVDIFLLWIGSCTHSLEIVIVPCSIGAIRGNGTVALKIEFCFLLRWHVTARIDLCLA